MTFLLLLLLRGPMHGKMIIGAVHYPPTAHINHGDQWPYGLFGF